LIESGAPVLLARHANLIQSTMARLAFAALELKRQTIIARIIAESTGAEYRVAAGN
jgi:hypothetical protein